MLQESHSRRGRRYSESERAAFLARYESSGLSVAAFCRREGIGAGTIHRWKNSAARIPFAELLVEPSVCVPSSTTEIILSTGDVIRPGAGCDPEWLGRVARALKSSPC